MAILVVTALAMTASRTAAAEPAARLVYLRGKGTETCPSESDVREAVQTRLGYDPFSSYAAATMLTEVSSTPTGFTANLKLVDGDGSVRGDRALVVQGRCAELMEAMALTISIAIDPMSVTRTGPPPGAPPTEKAVDPTLARSEMTTAPEPEPDETSRRRLPAKSRPIVTLSLGPLASLGSAPGLAVGGALAASAQLGRLYGGLEARADLPSSASAGALGRVESSLVAGSLFAGVREGAISACVVGSLGRLSATSSNVAQSNDTSAVYAAAGLRVGAGLPLSDRIEVLARGEFLANLQRHDLTISGARAYRAPAGAGNVGVAVAVRFQ